MSEKDKVKYEKHFSSLDVNRSGMVTAENAVQFLGKASLPEREIREIVRKRSRGAMSLTCDAFSLAMHDVYAVIKAKGSGGHGVTPMVSGERRRGCELDSGKRHERPVREFEHATESIRRVVGYFCDRVQE